jgi:hypothetical protein
VGKSHDFGIVHRNSSSSITVFAQGSRKRSTRPRRIRRQAAPSRGITRLNPPLEP